MKIMLRIGLTLVSLWLLPLASFGAAAPAPCDPAAARKIDSRFAVVHRVHGDVRAIASKGAAARRLHEGDVVRVGERVKAASSAEAVLIAGDASMIGVRPNANFVAESFTAQGRGGDRLALRLIGGGLRVITGWIGHTDRDKYTIATPSATLGIRGTDHEPFVLSAADAGDTTYGPGSYDKVNRGSTVLKTAAGELEIERGHVGFAVDKPRKRGLLTLLLPVLLERVPDFYVAGQFEKEMDEYSESADETSAQKLEQLRDKADACADCGQADAIAKDWIAAFDTAVERHDAKSVMQMFTDDVAVQATVRDAKGKAVVNTLTRKELADSAVSAMRGLEDYSQQRKTLTAQALKPGEGEACPRVRIKSVVVEQGKLAGKPYRLESSEEYVLALHADGWLAVSAKVTQR
jgi:hypothetical protein